MSVTADLQAYRLPDFGFMLTEKRDVVDVQQTPEADHDVEAECKSGVQANAREHSERSKAILPCGIDP